VLALKPGGGGAECATFRKGEFEVFGRRSMNDCRNGGMGSTKPGGERGKRALFVEKVKRGSEAQKFAPAIVPMAGDHLKKKRARAMRLSPGRRGRGKKSAKGGWPPLICMPISVSPGGGK